MHHCKCISHCSSKQCRQSVMNLSATGVVSVMVASLLTADTMSATILPMRFSRMRPALRKSSWGFPCGTPMKLLRSTHKCTDAFTNTHTDTDTHIHTQTHRHTDTHRHTQTQTERSRGCHRRNNECDQRMCHLLTGPSNLLHEIRICIEFKKQRSQFRLMRITNPF